ncbi:site-specific integrase [Salmonella enterica]|nr:site-specific integrase [Salmonella enterica]
MSCTTQPISQSLLQSVQAECIQNGKSRELSDSRTAGFKALVSKRGKVMFAARFSCGGRNVYRRLGDYPALSITQARSAAQKLIADMRAEYQLRGANLFVSCNLLFSGLLDRYEHDVLDAGVKRSADTDRSKIRNYLLPLLGHFKVQDIDEGVIGRYLNGLSDLKPATRNRHLALLKAIFGYGRRMKLVTTLPTEFIRMLPETTSRRRAMRHDEFQRWFKACEQKHHRQPDNAAVMLLMFLGLTGLRLGETRHLRLEDVEWSRKVITLRQTKNGRQRHVPVCDKAFVLLTEARQFLGDSGWVFAGKSTDNPVAEPRRLQKTLCETAGIPPYTIHELRHSFATILVESGADIHMVKELLGHSTVKVTEIYVHSSPERYHTAVNQAMDVVNS